jgi:hypothetical protein
MIDVALLVWGIAAFVALCFRLLLLGAEVFDLEKLIESAPKPCGRWWR